MRKLLVQNVQYSSDFSRGPLETLIADTWLTLWGSFDLHHKPRPQLRLANFQNENICTCNNKSLQHTTLKGNLFIQIVLCQRARTFPLNGSTLLSSVLVLGGSFSAANNPRHSWLLRRQCEKPPWHLQWNTQTWETLEDIQGHWVWLIDFLLFRVLLFLIFSLFHSDDVSFWAVAGLQRFKSY